MLKIKMLLLALAAAFIFTSAAADAADTVGLVNSRRVMFQHPRFEEASRILILLSRPIEGDASRIAANEANFSAQITAFAVMDRAIAAEQNPERREELWLNRQNRFSEFEASIMGPIFEDSSEAIQAVMARRGMTVALEIDSVFFGGTDITDDVIELLRRRN